MWNINAHLRRGAARLRRRPGERPGGGRASSSRASSATSRSWTRARASRSRPSRRASATSRSPTRTRSWSAQAGQKLRLRDPALDDPDREPGRAGRRRTSTSTARGRPPRPSWISWHARGAARVRAVRPAAGRIRDVAKEAGPSSRGRRPLDDRRPGRLEEGRCEEIYGPDGRLDAGLRREELRGESGASIGAAPRPGRPPRPKRARPRPWGRWGLRATASATSGSRRAAARGRRRARLRRRASAFSSDVTSPAALDALGSRWSGRRDDGGQRGLRHPHRLRPGALRLSRDAASSTASSTCRSRFRRW